MLVAALVLGVVGLMVLVAATLTYSTIQALTTVALAIGGLLLLAADGVDVMNWIRVRVAAIRRERVFESPIFVPILERGYVLLSFFLPSAHIRLHFVLKETNPAQDQYVTRMSGWLEVYLVAITGLLVFLVWSQSYPCAWRHSGWGCVLTLLAAWAVATRIGEILLQSIEVMLGRIRVDAASGLPTLAIYVVQTVAIFAICSEYAAYASGYQGAFKSDTNPLPSNAFGYAYLAWSNLVTFGAAYPPRTCWAMLIVVCSGITFILLFSVLLSFVVSKIQPGECKALDATGDTTPVNTGDDPAK